MDKKFSNTKDTNVADDEEEIEEDIAFDGKIDINKNINQDEEEENDEFIESISNILINLTIIY
jgi:hypothetical protein